MHTVQTQLLHMWYDIVYLTCSKKLRYASNNWHLLHRSILAKIHTHKLSIARQMPKSLSSPQHRDNSTKIQIFFHKAVMDKE